MKARLGRFPPVPHPKSITSRLRGRALQRRDRPLHVQALRGGLVPVCPANDHLVSVHPTVTQPGPVLFAGLALQDRHELCGVCGGLIDISLCRRSRVEPNINKFSRQTACLLACSDCACLCPSEPCASGKYSGTQGSSVCNEVRGCAIVPVLFSSVRSCPVCHAVRCL